MELKANIVPPKYYHEATDAPLPKLPWLKVVIKVIEAKGLVSKGKPDPYCKLTLEYVQTKTKSVSGHTPKWYESSGKIVYRLLH
jgi:hypothetical protein